MGIAFGWRRMLQLCFIDPSWLMSNSQRRELTRAGQLVFCASQRLQFQPLEARMAEFVICEQSIKEDWHRQFLSGTTVFVKKTVPEETVRAATHRT